MNRKQTTIFIVALLIVLTIVGMISASTINFEELKNIKEKREWKKDIQDLIKTSEKTINQENLKYPVTFQIENGKLILPSKEKIDKTTTLKGKGYIVFNSNTEIYLAIQSGEWCARYDKINSKVEVINDKECTLEQIPTREDCFETHTNTLTRYKKEKIDCPTDVVIPKIINGYEIQTIGSYAFVLKDKQNNSLKEQRLLTSVKIPSTVEVIENNAFLGQEPDGEYLTNQLENVDFSEAKNLKKIEANAFNHNWLNTLDLKNTQVIEIQESAFNHNNLTSIKFNDTLKEIDTEAFKDNNLINITLPKSVTTIKENAFAKNKLKVVTIKGKTATTDFEYYPSTSPFDWITDFSDDNITWEG